MTEKEGLTMTESEGLRMTKKEGLRMTESDGLRMTVFRHHKSSLKIFGLLSLIFYFLMLAVPFSC
jgi:hypothetical protein